MPSVLITGSSGFVGSCTREEFANAGWQTIGIGRRKTDQSSYIRADLAKPFTDDVLAAIKGVDVVLHAAARSSPWGTRKQFHAANVTATENIVQACQDNGCPKLLFVSSSSVYYRPEDQFGINEFTPLAVPAVNHYADSKQLAERVVKNYRGDWVILRPRAVYGKGDSVLFPRILAAAKAGKLPLLTRPDSPVVGDLISIDNLAHYIIKAATDKSILGEFNLTDNEPQEIIAFLLNVFDRLGIARPTKQIPVATAFRIARVIELLYGAFLPWKEPPITRFGVHVFAYSKVFDVANMLERLGPPPLTTAQSVDRFVAWVHEVDPYGLSQP
ncbi:NAD(P)-dependent oxidoreductase [Stieleria sp. JC731]|uniref:NAD-dependent epimerase/dehydratase family protein n=1 Tax=Pirellulaceae TaxID=2691357 RepID=UPI001E61C26C|nr:NAD(P)-dependent oxidoreductase [Stieleria sp. JC731]MCC9598959.1 NAD(P)-dependent oxidoreductase [Stieleria sp. JC731]